MQFLSLPQTKGLDGSATTGRMIGPPDSISSPSGERAQRGVRLDSWKEIAAYLNRDVRTVQRGEKSARLPVGRLPQYLCGASDKSVYGIIRLPCTGGAAELVFPGYRLAAGVEPSGKGLYVTRSDHRSQSELPFVPLPSEPEVHPANVNFANDALVRPEGIYYLDRLAESRLLR